MNMRRNDPPEPSLPVSHGLNHYEPSEDEMRKALRFSPERCPETRAMQKRKMRVVGGIVALSGAGLAYWGYRLGGVPTAVGMLCAASVATLFRLFPSLLAARERRADAERARRIAIQNRFQAPSENEVSTSGTQGNRSTPPAGGASLEHD